MDKKTIRDVEVAGKKVIMRTDFNEPLDERTGHLTDDIRIRAAIPTIEYLVNHKAKVILCSHLGRPKGKRELLYSLQGVAKRLSELLRQEVRLVPDCIGAVAEEAVSRIQDGDVILLENLRFHPGEEQGDPAFAEALARLGELYVDDAFGTAHRAHASIVGIAKHLPAVSGLLLEKEVMTLGGVLQNPVHPFGLLLGGAKVNDKVALIENVMSKVDHIIIGGGMAASFLKAKNYEIGRSLLDGNVEVASYLIQKADKHGVKIHLPADVVVTDEIKHSSPAEIVPVGTIPPDKRIADIGPLTVSQFRKVLEKCKTVFWNGPMGVHEIPQFSESTFAVAGIIAGLHATTIIGGGSTAEVVTSLKLNEHMSFVSTGGGASLEFLSGQMLPGVAALLDR
ncbi:MAG: phosphoglycerate kinase [Dehalococcoidia bacterium]|nr:phosphoglycerate kinase [Dehalococcoidia bacterium]